MKICYLVHDMNPKAGWGRLSHDLISGVKRNNQDVVILKEIDDGFDGIPVLDRGIGIFTAALRARKYLKDCDVIHALDVYPYGIIAVLATLGIRKKIVISLIGTYSVAPLCNPRTTALSRMSLRSAAVITSISNFTAREVCKKIFLKNIEIITPGINPDVFYKRHNDIPKENFIISVGVLKERKGYHNAIPAFALAKKTLPDLKYVIVGNQNDKNYFEELQSLARAHGVENDIQFLQNISDEELSDLYKDARAFILTSVNNNNHFEGFGIVFLEAAAAGLPVVGTLGNGIEDAIKDGYNGILVPQNDIPATAEAIIDILSNKEEWSKMSAQGYVWVKENSIDGMIAKYINIYNKLQVS